MTYPTFDQYIKEDLDFYYCEGCGRKYENRTTERMDETSLPCICGAQVDSLVKLVPFLDGHTYTEDTVSWDKLVKSVTDSGMWRCRDCGLTAPEKEWDGIRAGDEFFDKCPRCGEIEGVEIMKIKEVK